MATKILNLAKFQKAVREGQSLRITPPERVDGLRPSPKGTLYQVAEIVSKNPKHKRIIVAIAKTPQDLDGGVTAYWLDQFLKFDPYRLSS